MAKSVRGQLAHASDQIAILDLKPQEIVCITCFGSGHLSIQLRALALARVGKRLNIPRKKIDVSENSENVFVSFDARGVHWSTCIGKADLPEFYTAMGVEVFCRLAVEPLALAGDPTSHLLEQKVV